MNPKTAEHVALGLSGGVDSSVAALRLLQEGKRVTAVFMKNWEEDDDEDYCAAEEDLLYAREVCAQLDLPLRTVNFASEYWDRVFDHFLREYRAGRTPNPDVLCNREIKFKAFLDFAMSLGADCIATGHYARRDRQDGRMRLLRAADRDKDQSYFLYMLGQRELEAARFPLGELRKTEVREIAREAGFSNHDRKDSTGICFIGERRFRDFLQRYLPAQPGEIRTLDGALKGRHDGLMYATIGQRHGLGIGGPGEAWYVAAKDLERNILYVVQGHDHPALYDHSLAADDLHWVSGVAPALPLSCTARIRYRQTDEPARVESDGGGAVRVRFERQQRAITPGQSVVFYEGEVCLGGGIIRTANAADAAVSPRSGVAGQQP
jgi:tRNA-specific 2-thiouridylase